jgi:DNA-binding IclR family transcriptional regulator
MSAAILDATTKLTPAGKVLAEVKRKTGQSPATINRRIAALMELGLVERQGGGPSTQYRSSGLV